MQDRSFKFLSLCGSFAGVLAIAVLALTNGEPSDESPTVDAIVTYYGDHRTVEMLSGFLLVPLIALFLLFFTSALRSVLRSGETNEATWSTVVGASMPLVALSLLFMAATGMAITEAVDSGASEVAHTIYLVGGYDWLLWAAPGAATMLATGIGALKTATLPRPYAVVSIVLGLVAISPLGMIAFLMMPLWLIASSVVMLRMSGNQATRGAVGQPLGASA